MRKKHDILNAAERLFYTNGFHATSTDLICQEAGVSTRTLYHHFPSREQLTSAVMDERKQRFFDALPPPEQPDAIPQLFHVLAQWMQREGALGCFFAKAWGEYSQQDPRLAAQALDYRYLQRDYIAACIRHSHGADTEPLANAIWIVFEGAITAALISGAHAAISACHTAQWLMANAGETA